MLKAAHLFGTACDGGHGQACFRLAFLLDAGSEYKPGGPPRNEARAWKLNTRSCELDFLVACWHVGLSYATGDGVAVDRVRGFAPLDKACRGGEQDACEWIETLELL